MPRIYIAIIGEKTDKPTARVEMVILQKRINAKAELRDFAKRRVGNVALSAAMTRTYKRKGRMTTYILVVKGREFSTIVIPEGNWDVLSKPKEPR